MNLAPAVAAIVHGHGVPNDLWALALMGTAIVLMALVLDWVRQLGV